jgi:hypothetical protein
MDITFKTMFSDALLQPVAWEPRWEQLAGKA